MFLREPFREFPSFLHHEADENAPLVSKTLSKTIESAQKKIEGQNFGIRKNTVQYDDVMNRQRELIYKQRDMVLNGVSLDSTIIGMLDKNIEETVEIYCNKDSKYTDWNIDGLREKYRGWLVDENDFENPENLTVDSIIETLKERGHICHVCSQYTVFLCTVQI